MPLFTTTAALVAWMEDVYLSELVLMKATKKSVLVGMRDLDYEGARDRFHVWSFTPKGDVRWQVDGELDTDCELTLALATEVEAPVALRFHAGGTALLACASLEVEPASPKLRRARPRPWQHDFTMWSDDVEATVGQLLEALALPALREFGEAPVVADRSWALATLGPRSRRAFCAIDGDREVVAVSPVFRHEPGWTLGIQRRKAATDEEWDRAWRLPLVLPARELRSRTLRTDVAGWSKLDWRSGVGDTLYD